MNFPHGGMRERRANPVVSPYLACHGNPCLAAGRTDPTPVSLVGDRMSARFRVPSAVPFLALLVLAPAAGAQEATGDRLFRTRCASCHSLEPGQNRIGPNLSGIIGRKAGSLEGARYSQGLRDLGITWDAAQLDSFLANPRAMVKGTTMTVAVPNPADRAALIGYLERQPASN